MPPDDATTDVPRPPAGVHIATARRRPKLWWALGAGVALALVAIAAGLGGAEVAMRIAGSRPPARVVVNESACYFGFAPGTSEDVEHRRAPLRHRLRTDARGFRIAEGARAAAHGTPARCTVLAVGDSFTAGLWVEAEQAFPAVLESTLRQRGFSVRVDNGGVQGHTIAQERTGALGRWASPAHDIVVVARTANDLQDLNRLMTLGCALRGEPQTEFSLAEPEAARGLRVAAGARQAAARVAVMSERMRALRSSRNVPETANRARCDAVAEEYVVEAEDLARRVALRGGRVLFAGLEPFYCNDQRTGWSGSAFAPEYERRTRGAGAAVVELQTIMRDPAATLRPHDGHPSPEGHRRVALRLADELATLGWLERCREGAP